MRLRLPKLYPITDVGLSGISHAEQVAAFCRGGAKLVQLREKNLSPDEFFKEAQQAFEIARSFGAKLLINDRVDIALALGADGVHLGQDDMPATTARNLLGPNAIIGLSTHTLGQIQQAVSLPVSYLALGPIFSTKTKENPDTQVGLNGIRAARELIPDLPLVAIGGITLDNSQEVLAAGADSVAVIADLLFDTEHIEQRTRQFLSIL